MTSQASSGFLTLISLGHLPIWMVCTLVLAVIFRHHLMKILVFSLACLLALMPANKQDQVLKAIKILQPDPPEKDHR